MDSIERTEISLDSYFEEIAKMKNSLDYIYRGQSNSTFFNKENKKIFFEWKLISSYNRSKQFEQYRFNFFLTQQLQENLFRNFYRNNDFVKNNCLENADLITKLSFLQHYGIPTCLMDFTFDPYIALYFAMSSLPALNTLSMDVNGVSNQYPEEYKISIYRINHKLLKEKLNVKEIDNNLGKDYEAYSIETVNPQNVNCIGIYTNSEKNPNLKSNINFIKQKGAFILFDNNFNYSNKDYAFEDFVIDYVKENNIKLEEPIIKIYQIKYNELYRRNLQKHPDFKTAFKRLEEMKKTGEYLFNDHQGLKYDLIFFHNK